MPSDGKVGFTAGALALSPPTLGRFAAGATSAGAALRAAGGGALGAAAGGGALGAAAGGGALGVAGGRGVAAAGGLGWTFAFIE